MRTPALLSILALALASLGLTGPQDPEPLKVVATIPDLGDIVREVGGDLVDVTVVAKGTENVHAVRVRPSHLVAVSRADMLVEVGLSLEHGWVPGLLETARNPDLRLSTGRITVSNDLKPIEVPQNASRRNAVDVHPQGNPHVNLMHGAGRHFATKVRDALIALRPGSRAYFEQRHEAYVGRCLAAEKRWARLRKALEGRTVVVYHREFSYLLQDLGVTTLTAIEPKPGVPPTPRHLAQVIQMAKEAGGVPVLTAPWSNIRAVKKVAERSGGEVIEIPAMVGSVEDDGTWLGMMDEAHRRVAMAFGVRFDETEPVEAATTSGPRK